MLLRDFIIELNKKLVGIIPNTKVYGLTQAIRRKVGSVEEVLPGEVKQDGEIIYVGPDDTEAVIIYHRNAGITTARSPRSGIGDGYSPLVNTYQMAMIVFLDQKKVKLYPEELFLYIQSNIPDKTNYKPYDNVVIRTTNVILNSQLVFAAEYAGEDFSLPAEKSLFQINYTIESTHKKDCFAKCPEDC